MLCNCYGKQKLKFFVDITFLDQKMYYTYHGHSEMSLYPKILFGTYSNSAKKYADTIKRRDFTPVCSTMMAIRYVV